MKTFTKKERNREFYKHMIFLGFGAAIITLYAVFIPMPKDYDYFQFFILALSILNFIMLFHLRYPEKEEDSE